MNTETQTLTEIVTAGRGQHAAPSADFIHAISQFLDTNPHDLLVELGYYSREETEAPVSVPVREK